MTSKRLYKSRSERMIDGVCGGVAEFFGVDVTLVRITWVLLTLLGGSGIILYLVAMFIIPVNPEPVTPTQRSRVSSAGANGKFWGILLVVVGILWLLKNLDIPYYLHWWGFSWDYVLPVVLILAGVAFLFGGRNGLMTSANTQASESSPDQSDNSTPNEAPPMAQPLRLYKSRVERKLFGVCGGIATYANVDPTIIRILFIVAAFASFGFMFLLYIAMAIIVPNEPLIQPTAPTAP